MPVIELVEAEQEIVDHLFENAGFGNSSGKALAQCTDLQGPFRLGEADGYDTRCHVRHSREQDHHPGELKWQHALAIQLAPGLRQTNILACSSSSSIKS